MSPLSKSDTFMSYLVILLIIKERGTSLSKRKKSILKQILANITSGII